MQFLKWTPVSETELGLRRRDILDAAEARGQLHDGGEGVTAGDGGGEVGHQQTF